MSETWLLVFRGTKPNDFVAAVERSGRVVPRPTPGF
jgi:hypothetical protein